MNNGIYEWTVTDYAVKLEIKDNNEFIPKLVAKARFKHGTDVEVLIHDKYVTSYMDAEFNKENAKKMIINMLIYHLMESFDGEFSRKELAKINADIFLGTVQTQLPNNKKVQIITIKGKI